uniref:Eukaryotic translation elongation factor 1 gamma n=1 Tax=Coturnix japonica TaxID=93934 RepID=A0A8C2SS11_COTJA
MAGGTLYTFPDHWRSYKPLIAAQYSGAQLRVLSSPPHFRFGHSNRSQDFLAKFPAGKVPAFEGDDGFCVFESNAIAYYVSNEELRGSSREGAAQVLQWVNFADSDIVPPACTWVFPTLGIMHYNKQADGVHPPPQITAKKFAENQPKKETGKKEKKEKEKDKEKTKEKDKDSKEKEKDKGKDKGDPEEELDECEQALRNEPRPKDPFSHLPKSPFILDEFKRKYSNEDTQSVALPHLWEHFDPQGWSLWFCEYKYPEQLSQTFMSCNLISGMFQRLDSLRKHAFASVLLFGTNNDSSISGVWLMRGQELAFQLCPDWQVDYESYTWRRLDPSSPDSRVLVSEYFSWEGKFQHVGKPFNQGKIFK